MRNALATCELPYVDRVAALRKRLAELDRIVVAYSGGVDSSVLLHAAAAVLGDRAVGLIGDSPSLPREDLDGAIRFAAAIGVRLDVLKTDELSVDGYRSNAGDRCYWCRRTLFGEMEAWAKERGFATLAYGEITDDLGDDRPGRRAAGEFGVVAPLREAGLGKADVRRYARECGLEVADKPAAACLASRVPMGTIVTAERLDRIERAERAVRALGFRVLRVRDHGKVARLEVGADELDRALSRRPELEAILAPFEFERIDLAAYGA